MTDLQAWISEQVVGDNMLWKGAFGYQMKFIRDDIKPLISTGLEYEDSKTVATVISTHRSKSIVLPVVEMQRRDLGLRLVMRHNFYNWKLSVISERPVEADFGGLFHTTPPVEPDYTGDPLGPASFEGFPAQYIFGYYATDRRRFSAEIWDDNGMWTACFLFMKALGAVKPFVWGTRAAAEEQRKAREASRA